MSRLDALVSREKDGKRYYTKIGVAFPNRDGGYSLRLDALPIGGDILLKAPLPPREGRQVTKEPGTDQDTFGDDNVPF